MSWDKLCVMLFCAVCSYSLMRSCEAEASNDDALRAVRALERTASAVERLERSCR